MIALQNTPANDRERLIDIVDGMLTAWTTYAPYLEAFRGQLRQATAIPGELVPGDVITMNSRFVVQDRDGNTLVYVLAYPSESDEQLGRLSVLSPLGIVLYGARVGQSVTCATADGLQTFVAKPMLYQPEAAGDHHL